MAAAALALVVVSETPGRAAALEGPATDAAVADTSGAWFAAGGDTAAGDAAGVTVEQPADSVAAHRPLGWSKVLQQLDFPRESRTELEKAQAVLEGALASGGLLPQALPFDARRGRPMLAAVLWLAAAALLGWGCIAGTWRGVAGGAMLACFGLLGLAGGFDALLPTTRAANLAVVIEPRGPAHCEVILGAHYDSKTELLDHLGRGLCAALTAWAAVVGLCVTRWRPRAARILGGVAAAGLALGGLHLGSGLVLGARSHGIIDDAAACALLVEQARALHDRPLESTRVRCVWWAAEERGAQGSRAFVRALERRPDAVLNLESLGAGPRLGLVGIEWTGSGFVPPDLHLVAALQRCAPLRLTRLPAPAVTDAGPWLAIRVPAVTLLNLRANSLPASGLHGPRDRIEATDRVGVEAAGALVRAWLTEVDASGR